MLHCVKTLSQDNILPSWDTYFYVLLLFLKNQSRLSGKHFQKHNFELPQWKQDLCSVIIFFIKTFACLGQKFFVAKFMLPCQIVCCNFSLKFLFILDKWTEKLLGGRDFGCIGEGVIPSSDEFGAPDAFGWVPGLCSGSWKCDVRVAMSQLKPALAHFNKISVPEGKIVIKYVL